MKKLSYIEAKEKILKTFPDCTIRGSNRLPDGYLFVVHPQHVPDGEFYHGGLFKVTDAGEIEGYSPVMNPEEFKEALKHPIELPVPHQN